LAQQRLPTIDLTDLDQSDAPTHLVEQVRSALRDLGFFAIVNDGIVWAKRR
jgi:isopenicillin N synthase-like dioxygenase